MSAATATATEPTNTATGPVPDTIPDTMRAMVLDEVGGDFRLERRPVPTPAHGEVLVKVLAVGAGVTNELARDGVLGGSVPRVHGHELSGTVVALGPGVDGWRLGDQVVTSFYLLCGRCEWCASGRETLCENFGGFIGIAVDGAFADYAVLPSSNLVPIPDGVSVRDAGIVGDAIATPFHVVTQRLRMRAGQRVAVVGAGGGHGLPEADAQPALADVHVRGRGHDPERQLQRHQPAVELEREPLHPRPRLGPRRGQRVGRIGRLVLLALGMMARLAGWRHRLRPGTPALPCPRPAAGHLGGMVLPDGRMTGPPQLGLLRVAHALAATPPQRPQPIAPLP